MIPAIEQKSIEPVLPEMLKRFDMLHADDLGGFESHVFATTDKVLKLTHTLRRTPAYIEAEVAFTQHLAECGVPVPRPLPSASGAWVELLDDPAGGQWLAYAQQRLPGTEITSENLTPDVMAQWGRLTGQLHAHARTYRPSGPTRRRDWHRDPLFELAAVPAHLAEARQRASALIGRIRTWPQDARTYGLIHADLHEENLQWDGSRLSAIDFDDCEYNHYLYDLAVITHTLHNMGPEGEAPSAFVERFLGVFLPAYRQESPLPEHWASQMDDLLRLRDVVMLCVVCELWSVGTPDETFEEDAHRQIFERYAQRVSRGTPIVQVDWAGLAEHVTVPGPQPA